MNLAKDIPQRHVNAANNRVVYNTYSLAANYSGMASSENLWTVLYDFQVVIGIF